MKKIRIFTMSCCLMLFVSCTNDSEDDLVGMDDDVEPTEITYQNTIRAVIQSNCVGCHADPPQNGAPFPLVTFSQVSSRANGILTAISRQSGEARAMPPAGRLPQSTIDDFEEWIANGTPED